MIGYFIAVNKITGQIVTRGQSIYATEYSAKCGLTTWIRPITLRHQYVIIEITAADVLRLLAEE